MQTAKQNRTFFHILYSKQDDKWHVKKDNGGTIIAFTSKRDAIEEGMKLAEEVREGQRQVIVHKTNGTFGDIKSIS